MNSRVEIDIADHVAHVRMVRTDKMNALDGAMFDALGQAGARLSDRSDIRAIVLSGDGRAFCAGLDLQNFAQMADGSAHIDLTARTHGAANAGQQVVLQWREMPVPVIAAVHGVAFGGGFQLMLGADMRYMHPETKLSIMEIKWGLVPDMAGMVLLRDLIRRDVAAELTYSGRIFQGQEALAMGLATQVHDDPRAAALATARAIAAHSPDAIRAAKRIFGIQDDALNARILRAEAEEQMALISTPNQVEAVLASQERRAALFKD
ncbi:crotonase/enoyl-CoA hydratase family protein [Sphingobium sp. HBC34]|uniref:Crotonase/enoyl-CoA hydratase family protein n=1 Tax=Sphingobium cyanobacteriorum TaxID=3063954 RepID=A0ABT8ZR83_9SPHN|nr:crotonase/enoyl-CoA hydratase family protein [Sphingobium sp. HBC34]MDO7836469.1 crotonase/enoyl-CoA hydratase family protein [Sphingobium sp. HBC34]